MESANAIAASAAVIAALEANIAKIRWVAARNGVGTSRDVHGYGED